MKEYTDNEIIDGLRQHKSYVAGYLYERYLPMIRLMVYNLGGTTDDAKEIFQDGLEIIFKKIVNNDFVLKCKFKTYLYSVCENLFKTILTKRQAAANYFNRRLEEDSDECFSEDLDRKLYYKIFLSVLEMIDPGKREILKLYFMDLSISEIARKLGYTNGYVRKKKCKGQADLIMKIKKHPEYKRIVNSENAIKSIVY